MNVTSTERMIPIGRSYDWCDTFVSYHEVMSAPRHTALRRHKRWEAAKARRKGSTSPDPQRPKGKRAYSRVVTHKRDTGGPTPEPTTEQARVAKWWGGVVAAKEAKGWSRSKIADKAGLSRKDLYRWLDPAQAPKSPRSATIRRICEGLEIDYAEAAAAFGWTEKPAPDTPSQLEGKIRRARLILKSKSLTDEQRAKYESMLRGYERAYEGMLDELIEEFERDIDPSRE